MQTIFAYRQSREANYGIAQEYIAERFAPDLNSMEVQDKGLLNEQKQEALKIFKENYKNESYHSVKGSEKKVNEAVDDAIRHYYRDVDKDFKFFKKNMVLEAEKVHDQYISILNLIITLADRAEQDKRGGHENFVKNLLIHALKFNESLENVSLRRNLKWEDESIAWHWFKEFIKVDEEYQQYQRLETPTFEDDRAIINHIVKNILFKNDVIDKHMEEGDLNWVEDRAIIKSLVTKTIKSIPEDKDEDFELQELSYNWEDDKAFFILLFEETKSVESEYGELIAKKTKNWDIERIAATDKVILDMAISEMINFPSIPVKVTINEYIEIAKKYSTPKSKTFVNGVLDVIANELVESGDIRKSGRGLIDNK
ncbi:transcription antitermination factor NusB [Fulvivirga sediminis]|uniref:Transcription antitermination factor NusB n=1 Tax=Fulvivirga sediminis TaxID=2803949 RepID=A0A937JXF6_9BACT|nr:transcription antitermination factor NusB [Fulvivirga sediminis]MBL3654579.1 transcription antitermination factor NusB [Fulvivirga sediminis]